MPKHASTAAIFPRQRFRFARGDKAFPFETLQGDEHLGERDRASYDVRDRSRDFGWESMLPKGSDGVHHCIFEVLKHFEALPSDFAMAGGEGNQRNRARLAALADQGGFAIFRNGHMINPFKIRWLQPEMSSIVVGANWPSLAASHGAIVSTR